MKTRISWRAKLEKGEAKIEDVPPTDRMAKRWGWGKMLIARPLDVDGLIRQVPQGKLITINQIRVRLAKDCGADFTCPLTTGIFVRIAAEAAEEDRRNGQTTITPYWRVVRDDGSLLEKFPGGIEAQAGHLVAEGHSLEPGRGQKLRVRDFERASQVS